MKVYAKASLRNVAVPKYQIRNIGMLSDDMLISKSRSILNIMWHLFGNPARFSPVTFEMTFSGDRQKIKKAARLLEHERIWYRINWVHKEEDDYPNKITLQFDNVSLKK